MLLLPSPLRETGVSDLNLNGVALDAHLVTADLEPRVVGPGAVSPPEPPGVPGTGHDVVFHVAAAERRPHVRTDVVDGEELAVLPEDGNELVVDADRLALALGDVADAADRVKLGHDRPFANLTGFRTVSFPILPNVSSFSDASQKRIASASTMHR